MELRDGTIPVEVYRKKLARKEKLLADLRAFKDERGVIVGWEAPAFKAGYTLPLGVTLNSEEEARTWFVDRVADGSFDFLLLAEGKKAGSSSNARREPRKRRLVNPSKFRTDREIEKAIEAKKAELIELEARRQEALAAGGPDKLAGVITKGRAYLEELQVLRSGLRGKF